jgi:hypothetical protein
MTIGARLRKPGPVIARRNVEGAAIAGTIQTKCRFLAPLGMTTRALSL